MPSSAPCSIEQGAHAPQPRTATDATRSRSRAVTRNRYGHGPALIRSQRLHHPNPPHDIESVTSARRVALTCNSTLSIRTMEPVHPHDPKTRNAAALLATKFGQLMGRDVEHIRVDMHDRRQSIQILGTVASMHGPQGVCIDGCPRVRRRTVDGDEVGVT